MYPGGLPMGLRLILLCPGAVTVLEDDVAFAVLIPNNQDGALVGGRGIELAWIFSLRCLVCVNVNSHLLPRYLFQSRLETFGIGICLV